jgi:septum formation protein
MSVTSRLILASSSPRRRELLANAKIAHEVCPAEVPEVHTPGEKPQEFATRLACDKARIVAAARLGNFVLGADTIVVVDDAILGKPSDEADALRMLRMISGRKHVVTTAICVIDPAGQEYIGVENSLVFCAEIPEPEMRAYIANGEPMDKAGAYAIQGMASKWIYRVEGDYFTVMGLPVALLWRTLREAGFDRGGG